ncbi:DNA ligase D [Xanthomonas maliensis]|uniref:DNA ligase D n=1 Tax=Xanthomonas maliensis TaxID=1321368 RepID=UPI0003A8F079|nr:DNA ligase D [Xanthomonas maliensis]KAB7764853.1 DNA ligase D [Xanthomonas maliensis]
MSLSEYRRKRRFDRTGEPEPGKRLPRGQRAIFVVQLHHASRRHYDFRLQVGDALKSWAVPKGPSYDPKVKRMAVEVEDHPLDYAQFEGQIPRGEYGGGHVAQFDHGVWTTAGDAEAQLAKGHLRFELFGSKLKGGWHLVRSGKPARQPQWLLFKDEDAYAGTLEADDLLADVTAAPAADVRRAGAGKPSQTRALSHVPAPRRRRVDWARRALALTAARRATLEDGPFAPQLAKLGANPPEGAQWLHEIKWDGYRLLATVHNGVVRLWSRNALEWTDKVPEVRDAIQALGLRSAQLDGELIAGRGTRADFNLLQATLSGERQAPLALVVFDLLHLDGVDLSGAPLRERKQLLQAVLEAAPPRNLAYSSHIEGDGAQAFRVAGEQHFEGIISKRAERAYQAGRSEDWRKTKQLASQEFAVVGYTTPKGSRGSFGALLLATPDAQHGWRYVGRVGSGFSDAMIPVLAAKLGGGDRRPCVHVPANDTDLRSARWFAPRFVVEVVDRGIGGQALLRQASFKTLRNDKTVEALRDTDSDQTAASSANTATARKRSRAAVSASPLPTLSSPGKLIYPDIRASKGDVWAYYQAVMPQLLPQIVGRPLSVIRCPSGAHKPCFFQKHHSAGLERVGTMRLAEDAGLQAEYLVVEDAAGLLELVQFNALEFHPWGACADQPERADRVVFDLDPGPDVPFAEVKRAASDIRRLLAQLELESFLRVSGGKGLHVVVPLNPGCDWELTKRFAKGFAEALAQSEPARFIATASKRLRNTRIFVDYLRNGRGATAVASYSLRARPGAPVALPLAWSELPRLHRADAFTLREVPERLRRRRKDPWAALARIEQNLARWAAQE